MQTWDSPSWLFGRSRFPTTLEWLDEGFGKGHHIGVQLSVSHGGCNFSMAAGEAIPGRRLSPNTLVWTLCASQPIIAATAVRAVEQGLILPFSKLSEFLPELRGGPLQDIDLFTALSHRVSGVVVESEQDELYIRPLQEAVKAVAATIRRDGVAARDARESSYASWAFILVAAMLERVYESPFKAIVKDEVFDPLGMTSSYIGMTPDEVHDHKRGEGIAHLYDLRDGRRPVDLAPGVKIDPLWALPTVGMRATCSDIVLFYEALANARKGEQEGWLSPLGALALTARHRIDMPERGSDVYIDFGLGVELESRYYAPRLLSFGPSCSTDTFGHKGESSFISFHDPSVGLSVSAFLNGQISGMAHGRRVFVMSQRIYEDLGLASLRRSWVHPDQASKVQ